LSEVSQTRTQSKASSADTLSRFATRVERALSITGDVNVRITSNREMQSLNRRFRKKNKPTDVLTFPSAVPDVAGDIAVSLEIAAANAEQLGHSLDMEVKILILHGMLHLAGYDHEIDDGEMHAKEAELRMKLRLPVGLIQRSVTGRPKKRVRRP
jgi:probable rRNA maturation factor